MGAAPHPYLHLQLFLSAVATTSLIAMVWANNRRGGDGHFNPYDILANPILWPILWLLMHAYVLLIYHIPALLLLYISWAITSEMPLVKPDIPQSESISEVATLLSIGPNFANVASTYRHRGFWGHILQFGLAVVLVYYGMVGAVWALTRLFANAGWSSDSPTAGALRLLVPTVRAPHEWLDALLIGVLLFVIGAGSYALRAVRERRGFLLF